MSDIMITWHFSHAENLNHFHKTSLHLAPLGMRDTLPSGSYEKATDIKCTVYPKKYAHGFCFAVLCCGYTLTDFPISIRLTSLALWQSNDCPSASKATLMNMDKYFMWIHYERLRNHNKAKHNKTVCIFLGIYCTGIKPFRQHPNYTEWWEFLFMFSFIDNDRNQYNEK